MNAEGIALSLSPEWLMTTATVIPVVVAALVLLWLPGWLYRQTLAVEHAEVLVAWQQALGGQWRPSWRGWRLVGGRRTVHIVDGPSGPWTCVDGAWTAEVLTPEAG